jgi:hypothetical protein
MVLYRYDDIGNVSIRSPASLVNEQVDTIYATVMNANAVYNLLKVPYTPAQNEACKKHKYLQKQHEEKEGLTECLQSIFGSTRPHCLFITFYEVMTWLCFTKFMETTCRDLISKCLPKDLPTPLQVSVALDRSNIYAYMRV